MIGICVVYLIQNPDGYDLLDLSVMQLKRHTSGPYRLYGCCPDGDARTLARMEEHGIRMLEVRERYEPSALEHSVLLDELVDHAIADGCTHVATFDMDSWPVQQGWDALYRSALTERTPVASIVRTELGDNFPCGAFICMRSEWWRPAMSSFRAGRRSKFTSEAVQISSRPNETGAGILAQLYDERRAFWRMERSNRWDVHPVMAAVYDNAVFHLGAGSRQPKFISDQETYSIGSSAIRRAFATQMNKAIRRFTLNQVLSRHDPFVEELMGGPARPLLPLETDPIKLPRVIAQSPVERRRVWTSDSATPHAVDAGAG